MTPVTTRTMLTRGSTRRVVMSQAEYNAKALRAPDQADRDRVRALLQQRGA